MSFSIKEQNRILKEPNNDNLINTPKMPLLIINKNGVLGEAKTIRGAAALIIGQEYFDCEDGVDEWHLRVESARKEAMNALIFDINVEVHDSKVGEIKNNYAADPDDPDYEVEDATDPPIKIFVDNDKLFLLSLMKLQSITILEREDSYLLRPFNLDNDIIKNCGTCIYKENSSEGLICPVYNELRNETDGKKCSSYSNHGSFDERHGGEYINIIQEYDLEKLIIAEGA